MAENPDRLFDPLHLPPHRSPRHACFGDRPTFSRSSRDRSLALLLHPTHHRPNQSLHPFTSMEQDRLLSTSSTSRDGLDGFGHFLGTLDDSDGRDQALVFQQGEGFYRRDGIRRDGQQV